MKTKFFIGVCVVFLLISYGLTQQPGEISYHDHPEMPAGKIGDRIQSIIDTVNSNDPGRIQKFIQEECTAKFRNFAPMEQHIEVALDLFRQTGGVDFYGIRTYTPERKGETVVIIKDRNFDSWRAFVVTFSNDDQYLVDGLQFTIASAPDGLTESSLTTQKFLMEVEELVQKLCAQDVFSGSLLIAKDDEILFTLVCGEASKRFHVPNNIDTKFNLGSMNKMFTATAIVQLKEKGKLSFNDPISKYVDESWLPEDITSKITIHHLLTHTSGLGSYFNSTYDRSSRQLFRNVDDFKPLVKGDKPAFEPGARFRYSNTGMLLLGVVIEKVTGESYFDYIRKNIYEPAGMINSDSYEMDYPVENLAIGYSPDRKSPYGWQNNLYKHVIKGGPAGGGFSTVKDLHKFARALLTGKLVSPESLDVMWKDYSGEYYGYGFVLDEGESGKVVGHSGGFPGINSTLDMYVDKGYIVAVMSNYDSGASPIARKIKQLIARIQ